MSSQKPNSNIEIEPINEKPQLIQKNSHLREREEKMHQLSDFVNQLKYFYDRSQ